MQTRAALINSVQRRLRAAQGSATRAGDCEDVRRDTWLAGDSEAGHVYTWLAEAIFLVQGKTLHHNRAFFNIIMEISSEDTVSI